MFHVGDIVIIQDDVVVPENKGAVGVIGEIDENPMNLKRIYSVFVDVKYNSGFWYIEEELKPATKEDLLEYAVSHYKNMVLDEEA